MTTWEEGIFIHALATANSSDCERRKVGAILVDEDNQIVSYGYNSAPREKRQCMQCPRRLSGVLPYSDYSNCLAVHAEARCLLKVGMMVAMSRHCRMYVTCEPCHSCKILLDECEVPYKWLENAGSVESLWSGVEPGSSLNPRNWEIRGSQS